MIYLLLGFIAFELFVAIGFIAMIVDAMKEDVKKKR